MRMVSSGTALTEALPGETSAIEDRERLTGMAREHFQFVWRCLRRLGVPEPTVDDAAQQVFETASRKLDRIAPGSERAFLFQTAVRVASGARRRTQTRREVMDEDLLDEQPSASPGPEEATQLSQRRALLDEVLDAIPLEMKAVFVLFELEELSTLQIAPLLGVPVGTVASRLRRARELFHASAKRVRARNDFRRGER
jgi:RNA polymerase sigma-70 factor, ECF subfamily